MVMVLFKVYLLANLIDCLLADKITLFDSTKYKEDLNWLKLSYIDNTTSKYLSTLLISDNDYNSQKKLQEIQNNQHYSINSDDMYGWKESSFASLNGDDVWRIYFVCDLNVKNIQNWLFTPILNTKFANRLTINLTYTIRECEQFPSNKLVKTCKEKFELYYEEFEDDQSDELLKQNEKFQANNIINKLKNFKFRDTFVADTAFKYNNRHIYNQNRKSKGELINIEQRELALSENHSFIRLAIRDTGACISLLAIDISYLTCPKLIKYGITFPETSTGRDLTDLIQVSGICPLYSTNSQIPKAICTGKGEWLITDQNLSNRCLCLPGYEFDDDNCLPCKPGTYKQSTGNDFKCISCPSNSWSSYHGADKCDCLRNFYRENEFNASSDCKEIEEINTNNLNIIYLNDLNDVNITLDNPNANNKNGESIKNNENYVINCYLCQQSDTSLSTFESCSTSCLNDNTNINNNNNTDTSSIDGNSVISSSSGEEVSNKWLKISNTKRKQKYKYEIIGSINQNIISNTTIYVCFNNINYPNFETDLSQYPIQVKTISCLNNTQSNFDQCYNLTIHLTSFNLFQTRELFNNAKIKIYRFDLNEKKYTLAKIINNDQINAKHDTMLFSANFCHDLVESSKLYKVQIVFMQPKRIHVYFFDLDLNEVCSRKVIDINKNARIDGYKFNISALMVDDNKPAQSSTNGGGGTNVNLQVLLPIVLSCAFVTFFVFSAICIRSLYKQKSKSTELSCKRKLTKFFPIINKSCANNSTSCSNSSTSESSSQSTTISQILSQSSKLYYVDPHTYEDPSLAVQQFANEIDPNDIKIESVIGGGEFGDVCKGKLRVKDNNWITVAIKTLKVGSSERSRCDFLTEASIMAQFHHENIIFLEGVVTKSHPYMIITEYMDNGSLDTFLRLNSWRLNIKDLIKILKDIASGMRYLSEMNFVHRDLAARNILLNKDLTGKVADFGLSREIESDNTDGAYWTKGGKIPVRWTAPEAISYRKFTCSSDVWSYGVLAWEVMSYGERPYWNWSNQDVIKSIEKGFRLPMPTNCPVALYDLMYKCWNMDRLLRPKFREIVKSLETLNYSDSLYTNPKAQNPLQYIDTNRPNIAQLTNIEEWLISINLTQYLPKFKTRNYLNLSQVLNFNETDLETLCIWEGEHKKSILTSLKCIQFEISFQNGFLV